MKIDGALKNRCNNYLRIIRLNVFNLDGLNFMLSSLTIQSFILETLVFNFSGLWDSFIYHDKVIDPSLALMACFLKIWAPFLRLHKGENFALFLGASFFWHGYLGV